MAFRWTAVMKTVAFVLGGSVLALAGLAATAYLALMAFVMLLFTLSPPENGLGIGP